MLRDDGGAWAPVALGRDVPLLNWLHGFGPDDLTVVGNGGTILHFDGVSWQTQSTTVTEDLWGVWGAAPNDLWAVGGRGRAEGQQTLLRFDGTTWRKVPTPALSRPNVFAFFKVWGPRRATCTSWVSGARCCTTTALPGPRPWWGRAKI